ncbi:hypothetical protein C3L33_00343, partial [Rhododendron williamsianum]
MALMISPPPNAKPFSVSQPPRATVQTTVYLPRIYFHRSFHHSVKKGNLVHTILCSGNRALPVASATLLAAAETVPESNFGRIALSDVVVKRRRNVYWGRKWNSRDVVTASVMVLMHLLCFLAPFNFNWGAFWVAVGLYVVTGLLGITLSFHRNLSHRSFKLPKWLEYFCAYCGAQALQCGNPNNVGDLEKQPFYRFLRRTYVVHPLALALLLFAMGGFPFIVWGMLGAGPCYLFCGSQSVWLHRTWVWDNPDSDALAPFFQACHVWGKQAWNTGDLSRNNWWVALLAFGEGWHNNHHAFEYSARHGLEWWQIDMTWYAVRFFQAIGLATDVKLPTEAQKERMAFSNGKHFHLN